VAHQPFCFVSEQDKNTSQLDGDVKITAPLCGWSTSFGEEHSAQSFHVDRQRCIHAWPQPQQEMGVNTTIHTGYWIDYSKGTIRGQLITLHSRDANIVIAFLAVFVTVTGLQLWCKL
jgi:hypothetical protein